jgi:hypothetical protein
MRRIRGHTKKLNPLARQVRRMRGTRRRVREGGGGASGEASLGEHGAGGDRCGGYCWV